jgi:hypothetical protein
VTADARSQLARDGSGNGGLLAPISAFDAEVHQRLTGDQKHGLDAGERLPGYINNFVFVHTQGGWSR